LTHAFAGYAEKFTRFFQGLGAFIGQTES